MMLRREILHSGRLTLGMASIQMNLMRCLCQNHSSVQKTLFNHSLTPSILELVYCLILMITTFLNALFSQVVMMMLMTLTMLSSITFPVNFKCSKVLIPLKIMMGMEKKVFWCTQWNILTALIALGYLLQSLLWRLAVLSWCWETSIQERGFAMDHVVFWHVQHHEFWRFNFSLENMLESWYSFLALESFLMKLKFHSNFDVYNFQFDSVLLWPSTSHKANLSIMWG